MLAVRARTLPLGTWLAARGALPTFGIALAILAALTSVVAALIVARSDGNAVAQLPTLEATAIAWVAGLVLAFGAAARALGRDREQGVLALVLLRGGGLAAYVRGRVGGVVVLLAVTLGGATLVGGLAAVSVAHPVAPAVRGAVAGLAYALAFAATVGPIAMAMLGARTQAGGYLSLLAVLVVPELLAPWTASLLPSGWYELTSVPAALAAVRAGVAAPAEGAASLARALAGLVAVVAMSLVVVAARAHPGRTENPD
jgi:hypothetical protein